MNLIDNMSLRQAIRAARNRTEAYHQLQGLIRKIYRGVFKGRKVVNNRVSAQAVRLIANCIIAHNGIILNTIYEKMLEEGVAKILLMNFFEYRLLRGCTLLLLVNTVLRKVTAILILHRWLMQWKNI